MPVIDNQKMACEPCIRGHRSTKCNHANERMMIPVRKPGRPLSVCPHPPNNRCSCTSVTAALPRTRRCGGCVSKSGASAGPGPVSSAKAVPRSPPKRSFSSSSVQMPSSQQPMGQGPFIVSVLGRSDMGMPPDAPAPTWPNGGAPSTFGGMAMPGQQQKQQQQQQQQQQQEGGYMLSMPSNEYLPGQSSIQQVMIPMAGGQFQHNFQLPGQGSGSQIFANGQLLPQFSGFSSGVDMAPFGPTLDGFAAGSTASPINGYGGGGAVQFTAQPTPPQAAGSCCGSTPTPPDCEPFSAPAMAAEASSCCAPPSPCCAPPSPCCASLPLPTTSGSCCGPTTMATDASSTDLAQITPASSRNSLASNGGTASCCAESSTSLSSSLSQHVMLKTEESMVGGPTPLSSIAPVPQAVAASAAHQQLSQDRVYANVVALQRSQQSQQHGTPAYYRYAPQFGTASTPLQQSQWRSSLIVMGGASGADGGLLSTDEGIQPAYGASEVPAATGPAFAVADVCTDADGNSHLCSCGDDCNCVGCVAHPYNAATQNAVQAAWQAIDDSSSTSSGGRTAKAPGTHAGHAGHAITAAGVVPFQLAGATATANATANSESSSPVQEFTPSDTADDPPLSADDFLFVNYSVAACIGEDLICPCGDDCQCFGCTLHNPRTSAQ